MDAAHTIAHNKIMIIDKQTVYRRQLQLHEGGRGEERREPFDHTIERAERVTTSTIGRNTGNIWRFIGEVLTWSNWETASVGVR